MAGFLGGLVTPRGQVRVCAYQSMWKSALVKPGRQVLARRHAAGGQALMNGLQGVDVLFGRRPGHHVHDDIRALIVAGLALMVAVADPLGLVRRCGRRGYDVLNWDLAHFS